MPVLELPNVSAIKGGTVLAVPTMAAMLYPKENEAVERRQWQAAAMAKSYYDFRKAGAHWLMLAEFHGWIGDLWDLPQAPRRVVRDGVSRIKRATYSGDILRLMIRLARYHPAHCTLEKVKAIIQEVAPRTPSDSLLSKVWPEFQSASPLWAGFLKAEGRKGMGATAKSEDERWIKILAAAEAFRREAEATHVLTVEPWKAPDSLKLPSVELEITPMPLAVLAFLNQRFR
jgi:hypothetical protein